MAYTPQHVANYFLDRADREGRAITQMQLQKLVYIAYGWALALKGERLFDEPIEAWEHGPVIRSLYDEFKRFGKGAIQGRATEFNLENFDTSEPRVPESDKDTFLILDKVWAAYHRFSGWQLRQKTHEPDTPWSVTYDPGKRDKIIPDEVIRPHFFTVIRRILDAARSPSITAA
jgi:uncharacterized phage-associated protein